MNNGALAHRRTINWGIAAGLGLAAFILYLFTLAPTVLEADAGEFQFVPWLPGIAHPTGYPLYVLLGWLWSHSLPLGDVAWRMNLLSALFAAMTVMLLYSVARQILGTTFPNAPDPARMVTAVVAAATFAVTQTFWAVAIVAEVYTLHALLITLLLWLALRTTQKASQRYTLGLAFVFGLGLAHHITIILSLPALLLYLWLTGVLRAAPGWIFRHGVAAATPLLLYLLLPVTAPATPYTTIALSSSQSLVLYENSVTGFVNHITASVFRGELRPAAVGIDRFLLAGELLHQQVGWIGIGLAATGFAILWQKRCWDLLALTGCLLLAVVAFNLIYFIGDVFVLFIPAWLIICIWLGIGVLGLCDWTARSFVRHKMGAPEEAAFGYLTTRLETNMHRLVATGLSLFFFALPVSLLVSTLPSVSQRNNLQASLRWQEILQEPLPEGAVLLSNDRNEMMPMWYYQLVEQQRPDLIGLFPLIVPDPAYADIGQVLEQALASERPVFFIKPMEGLDLKADITPAGTLFGASPVTIDPTNKLSVELAGPGNQAIQLAGYDVDPNPAKPGDEVAITLYWRATQPLAIDYTSYVHLIDASGKRLVQSDQLPGGVYYPSSLWRPGEILRDRHTLTIPAGVQGGTYRLVAGMYHQPQPGEIVALGSGVEIGMMRLD